MNRKVSLTLIIVLLTASMLACQFSGILPTGSAPAPVVTPTTSIMPALAPAPASAPNLVNQQDKLVTLYQAVNPGVVTIIAGNALGSGWVYNADGIIVTNAHVVGTETKVEVDFPTGNKVYGKVLGADQGTDLAAIKVDVSADQLHPLALGDSDTLLVGQTVAAIGGPVEWQFDIRAHRLRAWRLRLRWRDVLDHQRVDQVWATCGQVEGDHAPERVPDDHGVAHG